MKKIGARDRLVLGVLVVWALVGLGAAYVPAVMGMSALAENAVMNRSALAEIAAKGFGQLNSSGGRYFIATNVAFGTWLALAVMIMLAGCCAAVPRIRIRRIAWGLYGVLAISALLLPIAEPFLRRWAGTPAWLCPDAVSMGMAFGLGGLALMGLSRWLCPNLFGKGMVPLEEPAACDK